MIPGAELRQGNLVEYINFGICEVIEVRSGCALIKKDNTQIIAAFEQLEPIEFKDKVCLFKNFECSYESGYRKKYEYIHDLRFGFDVMKSLKNNPEGFTFRGDCYPHVKYVHLVQNLSFFLSGKELILK